MSEKRKRNAVKFGLLAFLLTASVGGSTVAVTYFNQQPVDLSRPPADVPFELRVRNYWGGSCYHASTQVALRWADQGTIADNWRQKFGGGASTSDIARALDHYGIPYKRTNIKGYGPNEDGTEEFLNYAHDRRLVAAIHYFPNHAISFLGWAKKDGQEFAVLLDNNRVNNFIFIPKRQFLHDWQTKYHGGAIIPLVDPPPHLPYDPKDFLAQ